MAERLLLYCTNPCVVQDIRNSNNNSNNNNNSSQSNAAPQSPSWLSSSLSSSWHPHPHNHHDAHAAAPAPATATSVAANPWQNTQASLMAQQLAPSLQQYPTQFTTPPMPSNTSNNNNNNNHHTENHTDNHTPFVNRQQHYQHSQNAYPSPSPLRPSSPKRSRVDFTVTPQPGTREVGLFAEMRAMGFDDATEILSAIRHILHNNPHATADDCMLQCVQGREEMEEARKMDEARLASEEARKLEARERRHVLEQEVKDNILAAPFDDWCTNYFATSWILQDDTTRQCLGQALSKDDNDNDVDHAIPPPPPPPPPTKQALLHLLQQEQKARKWYGSVLPSAWFVQVCAPRLRQAVENDTLETALQTQLQGLEHGMFALCEQTRGGVPKMFLTAMDEFGDCNIGRNGDNKNNRDNGDRVHSGTPRLPTGSGTSIDDVICIED